MDFEQRCAVEFYFRLEHSTSEIFAKLQQVYVDNVLSKVQIFQWFKIFSEGRESMEHKPRNGRTLTARTDKNVNEIRDLVRSGRRLTV